jgi:hypothetical protein
MCSDRQAADTEPPGTRQLCVLTAAPGWREGWVEDRCVPVMLTSGAVVTAEPMSARARRTPTGVNGRSTPDPATGPAQETATQVTAPADAVATSQSALHVRYRGTTRSSSATS